MDDDADGERAPCPLPHHPLALLAEFDQLRALIADRRAASRELAAGISASSTPREIADRVDRITGNEAVVSDRLLALFAKFMDNQAWIAENIDG